MVYGRMLASGPIGGQIVAAQTEYRGCGGNKGSNAKHFNKGIFRICKVTKTTCFDCFLKDCGMKDKDL